MTTHAVKQSLERVLSIHPLVYDRWIRPRSHANQQREKLLNTILVNTMVIALIIDTALLVSFIIKNNIFLAPLIIYSAGASLCCFVLIRVSHYGYVGTATYIFSALCVVCTSAVIEHLPSIPPIFLTGILLAGFISAILFDRNLKKLRSAEQEKLQQLYRFVEFGRLSSGMFHDLMNPLTALIANIEHLERSGVDMRDAKEILTRTVSVSKTISSLMHTVKKQIKLDDAHVSFAVSDEIRDAITALQYHIRQTKTVLSFYEHTPITLAGYAYRFHHVMVNLLANALDACVSSSHKRIIIVTTQSDHSYKIIVKDTGSGIAPELLDKIFDPFFTTKQSHGVGLGLSSTKHIIEKYFHGTITVSSDRHKGTLFTIRIPKST